MPKILEIDKYLGHAKNRVARVGVELEGAWKEVPKGIDLDKDGSVFRGNIPLGMKTGEIPIGPMQPAAMPKVIKRYYPSLVDKTCGMHIHMSFEDLLKYGWLMDTPDYQDTIIHYLTMWAKAEDDFGPAHHIWQRLSGKSVFCQQKFWPDEQIMQKEKDWDQKRQGHRYTAVNYCGRIQTIEIRVLPMMNTAAQAIRAIKLVLDITNASLLVLSRRYEKMTEKLELPNTMLYEEVFEEELPLTSKQRKALLQ